VAIIQVALVAWGIRTANNGITEADAIALNMGIRGKYTRLNAIPNLLPDSVWLLD
jgi:hypothetical protein